MKRFLLCGGDNYYPESGDRDWFGFYDTREEAESKVIKNKVNSKIKKKLVYKNIETKEFLGSCYRVKENYLDEDDNFVYYNEVEVQLVDGDKLKNVDWHYIIDLENWQ